MWIQHNKYIILTGKTEKDHKLLTFTSHLHNCVNSQKITCAILTVKCLYKYILEKSTHTPTQSRYVYIIDLRDLNVNYTLC